MKTIYVEYINIYKSDHKRAPLINIRTTYPLEMVCIDYLSMEQSQSCYEHILVPRLASFYNPAE